MRILYDFISIQGWVNGGATHTKKIFKTLIESHPGLSVVGLYDSRLKFVGNDYEDYSKQIEQWVDIRNIKDVGEYISDNNIDVFYIGIFQRYNKFNLDNVNCKVIAVIHDVISAEFEINRIYIMFKPVIRMIANTLYAIGNFFLFLIKGKLEDNFSPLAPYYLKASFLTRENVNIVTVSNFSANSIKYNLPFLRSKQINVCYAPLKITPSPIEILEVKKLVDEGHPYFLLPSIDRFSKNVKMALDVMQDFISFHPNFYLVTTCSKKKIFDNHIALSVIGESELEYVYKHAYAILYPSIVEGFGSPPIEAMKYGTPVVCSNTSSIPEIVGDAGCYFCPILRSDLYRALEYFVENYKDFNRERMLNRYNNLRVKQAEDLEKLIKLIVE